MVTLRLRRSRCRKVTESQTTVAPPVTDPLESFADLLNRDQRTAVTINRVAERTAAREGCRSDIGSCPPCARPQSHPVDTSASTPCGCSRRNRSRSRGFRGRFPDVGRIASRLGEVFIVGVCVLTIIRVPAVMSAPSSRHANPAEQIHSHKATEDTLSYLYPCGKIQEEEMNNTYYSKTASKETDSDILKHIIIRTKNALAYAEGFRDSYVAKTFHTHFEEHHARWANHMYDWLPNESNDIPKRLGQTVDILHLQSKTFDEFLVNIYEYLQKFAVGLEQIVADQERVGGEFTEDFHMTEVHLTHVLCEIREAMVERNVSPRNQVPRSIMKDDVRHLDQVSYRNVRDWFIFRDLMNGLEYVIQVFTFIVENLPSSSGAASS